MADEVTATSIDPTTEAAPVVPPAEAPETAIQRIEDVAKAAIAEVEAKLEAVPAAIDARIAIINSHFDAFAEEVRANVSAQIPTTAHNALLALKETLRAKIIALF